MTQSSQLAARVSADVVCSLAAPKQPADSTSSLQADTTPVNEAPTSTPSRRSLWRLERTAGFQRYQTLRITEVRDCDCYCSEIRKIGLCFQPRRCFLRLFPNFLSNPGIWFVRRNDFLRITSGNLKPFSNVYANGTH